MGGGRPDRQTLCDAYGENLAKATLPGSGWTYHHDSIILQIHKIARQSRLFNEREIEDYFMRRLQKNVVLTNNYVPLLSKHLKGYVPDARQIGIACNKFPTGIDQLT